MKDYTALKWICGTIIISLFIIFFLGQFWVMSLANIDITTQIKMDDNTKEYLMAHDYCVVLEQQPYNSNKSDILFFGDCEYLDYGLFK